jgi:excisionase family DNA binding protein
MSGQNEMSDAHTKPGNLLTVEEVAELGPQPSDPSQILTPDDLAGRLKVSKSWVYEKTRQRSLDPLPLIRLGRYIRFYWPNVVAWLERHETK